jgi:hypothetical protein
MSSQRDILPPINLLGAVLRQLYLFITDFDQFNPTG